MKFLSTLGWTMGVLVLSGGCEPARPRSNPVQQENARSGTSDWTLTRPALKHEIEGYASKVSINRGEDIELFVNTSSPSFVIEIFRMGWYGGTGARRLLGPLSIRGAVQPPPMVDVSTGLVECNWARSYFLSVPEDPDPSVWASGIYLARLTAEPSQYQSYIIFVVRDDARPSGLLFQQSVTTYQAYNTWGGADLYPGHGAPGTPPARKVSFNRPYGYRPPEWGGQAGSEAGVGAGDFIRSDQSHFETRPDGPASWEYNMLRFLEREGWDVSYTTNIDVHEGMGPLLIHRALLSVGHDEYWSAKMRDNFESARDRGINLGFFSSNTAFWQIRLEPSTIDLQPDRNIVCYKSALDDPVKTDEATVHWRDPPVNRPENALIGVMYRTNPVHGDISVQNTKHWAFAGSGLRDGDPLPGLLGYEVDRPFQNQSSPANLVSLACSRYRLDQTTGGFLSIPGQTGCESDDLSSEMTMYTVKSGATVFATGSMQWSWGLDDFGSPEVHASVVNRAAQQITRNILQAFVQSGPHRTCRNR